MRAPLHASAALILISPGGLADGTSLTGSLWQCSRASDRSQFVTAFYPGGGVGGGELQNGEVSPYIFDASRTKQGEWPGHWEQTKERFIWSFPDQHMEISGSISSPRERQAKLAGTETASGVRSAVTCTALTKLPRIGEGLVIPRDSRFIDHGQSKSTLAMLDSSAERRPRQYHDSFSR
jgi:hypothetical protein